jgi:hypothetical protein
MIQWGLFALVLGVALVATVLITLFYAGFIRLNAIARADGTASSPAPGPMAGAIVCLVLAALTILFGLYVVVPQLHPWFK